MAQAYTLAHNYKLIFLFLTNRCIQNSAPLSNPSIGAHVLTLPHLSDVVGALQEAQQNFEAKKVEYDRAVEYRKETTQSASEYRPALFDAINNQLVNYHAGMVQFRDETFRNIADTINNWIVDAYRTA